VSRRELAAAIALALAGLAILAAAAWFVWWTGEALPPWHDADPADRDAWICLLVVAAWLMPRKP